MREDGLNQLETFQKRGSRSFTKNVKEAFIPESIVGECMLRILVFLFKKIQQLSHSFSSMADGALLIERHFGEGTLKT